MLEPADSFEAKEFAKLAFELSELYDTPVLLRMCTRIAHSQNVVELNDCTDNELKEYIKEPQKYIMSPANAIRRHPVVEERLKKARGIRGDLSSEPRGAWGRIARHHYVGNLLSIC